MLMICLSLNRKLVGEMWEGCLFWEKNNLDGFCFFFNAQSQAGLGEQMWYKLGKFI